MNMDNPEETLGRETPKEEMAEILRQQQVEQDWWKELPQMQDDEDIVDAVLDRAAVSVADGENYRISERAPEEFNVLHTRAYRLLEDIAAQWREKIEDPELSLIVTSMARTIPYQRKLQQRGYPAVENSSHTKLVAFDISTDWLQTNAPHAYEALMEVVEPMQEAGMVNLVPEPTVGVLHVCVSPEYEG